MKAENMIREIDRYERTREKDILLTLKNEHEESLNNVPSKKLLSFLFEEINIDSILSEVVKRENYKTSDEILVYLTNLGDEKAQEVLFEKYVDIIKQETDNYIYKGYYANGYEREDLLQESYIGFMQSIKNYKVHMRNPFRIFVTFVVKRTIELLMSKSRNSKQKALNVSSSYNKTINEDDGETFEEFLAVDEIDPDDRLENKELLSFFWEELSEFEKGVLIYHSEGYSYQKIGEIMLSDIKLEKNRIKSVDNAIQRINNKRKALLIQQ